MSLLLYAIADCRPEEIAGTGLASAPLRGIGEDSLAAVVSDHGGTASHPSEDQMWEYERAIEALMDRCAVLPARFGSRFEGEHEVREMVRTRRAELSASVQAVRGAVELSVSASWRPDAGPGPEPGGPATTGAEYMRALVERQQRAQALAQALAGLTDLARMSTHRLLPTPSLPFAGAYLVSRDRVDEFAERVRELDDQLADVELVCTGPWPPYSFAEGGPA